MNIQSTSHRIGSHDLALNDERTLLYIDEWIIKLTPTEHQLMHCFIDGGVVDDQTLMNRALFIDSAPTNATRVALEKHINNLRTKIRLYGIGIYRLRSYGYILAEYK